MGGAAAVKLKEIDISTRVASFEGVYGAMVVPARKGPADRPSLVTSDTQFLTRFTPDALVGVGFDQSHYSALAFLERSNKLWIQRAFNIAHYAGLVLQQSSASDLNAGVISSSNMVDPSARVFGADELILIYGANEGAWGNSVGVKVRTITATPSLIEPYAIEITVFKSSNPNVAVETFLVSRVLGQKDGRGRNMFIEDVLESSNYIRAISNPALVETILPKVQSTLLYMTDGNNGSAVNDSLMIAAANKFSSTAQVPITILMDGGYATPAYGQALDTIANLRQDCVAILSTPYEAEVDSDYINEIVTYRKTDLNLNSSYSALYTPHLQIQDRFNDRKIWISPDGHVGGSISLAANQYEIWYPAAGYKRGVLNVLDTRVRLTDGEMDLLTADGINPIKFTSGKGIVIWGQKTLQSRASALDRLNVRLMLIVIEPAIKGLLENFLFELNDDSTRSIIETKLESYLQTIKARKGVSDFDVVCDDSNNTAEDVIANRLNVDVFIKPMYSIEEIPVRIVITPSNISFSDAANAI